MAARNPEEVRRAADEILASPEFNAPEDSLWSQIARAILDPVGTIAKAIDWLTSRVDGGAAGGAVAWITVIIAVGVIAFMVWRVTRSITDDDRQAVRLAPDTGKVSVGDLLAEAQAMESSGDWRGGIRLRYAAMIAESDDAGVLQRRPGRTTGEYLRQVQANAPDATPAFADATAIFEIVWYGDGEADSDTAERFARLAESARRTVSA